MSWLFSRVLVEEYLGESCADGEPSVQSSGNHTQLAYLPQDKMTDFSRLSRFGMTFKPLTENRGEELLTLYLVGFHARTLVQLEKAQGLRDSDQECGEKWRGSFTKYDQDSRSWKTHQCSLLGDLEPFLGTWPRWGLMRDGECWEQQTLEQTIRGIGYGLSPDGVDSFHTPNTTGLDGGSNSRKALRKKLWATPSATDGQRGGTITENMTGISLPQMVNTPIRWPTPVTRDYKDTGTRETMMRAMTKRQSPGLALVVGAESGGKLNPTWVEWLMGWPLEWTDLKPLEMDKCHCVQQEHGKS